MFDRKAYMERYNREYYAKNPAYHRERSKGWIKKNPEKAKERRQRWWKEKGEEYRAANLARIREISRLWARKNRHKAKPQVFGDKKRVWQQEYREKNRDKIASVRKAYVKKRMKNDIRFKISMRLRLRILAAFRNKAFKKAYKSEELLGCKVEYAMKHIEKLFVEGMTWENYGEWEIDHIIPILGKTFDITNPDDQKKAFHYTNLQPLWKLVNRRKSNKVIV